MESTSTIAPGTIETVSRDDSALFFKSHNHHGIHERGQQAAAQTSSRIRKNSDAMQEFLRIPLQLRCTDTAAMKCRPVANAEFLREASGSLLVLLRFQNRQKRLLRDFHFTELLHAFLTLFLLLEQFAFSGNVAAVAFRCHVLAER